MVFDTEGAKETVGLRHVSETVEGRCDVLCRRWRLPIDRHYNWWTLVMESVEDSKESFLRLQKIWKQNLKKIVVGKYLRFLKHFAFWWSSDWWPRRKRKRSIVGFSPRSWRRTKVELKTAHKRCRGISHLQILQILLISLVLLGLAEETLLVFLWFSLDLFELLKGRILKSFRLKLIWFFKRMISNFCCQNVEGAIGVGVGFDFSREWFLIACSLGLGIRKWLNF